MSFYSHRSLSSSSLPLPSPNGATVDCSSPTKSAESEKTMGLPPLEYLECYLDSPTFREYIAIYEKELSSNSERLKALLRECKQMIKATEEYSRTLTSFAVVLGDFSFETEGAEKSEDERLLASSLSSFSETLQLIEESRVNLITTMTHRLVKNLEGFRKKNIHNCKEEKKKYDRATERYYQFMDKYLAQSPKKGGPLPDNEDQLVKERLAFQQSAFQYVCMIQDLHAQKQYELMEPIIGYFTDITSFFHQAYDAAFNLAPFVERIQHKVQLLREVFLDCQNKRYALKTVVLAKAQELVSQHPEFKRQGHLMVHERKGTVLQTGWVRYFGQFRKNEDVGCIGDLRLLPMDSKGNLPRDFMEVKRCVRCRRDDSDRRFCMELDLLIVSPGQEGTVKRYTVQAMNNDDRQMWMNVMEGKEPIYLDMDSVVSSDSAQLSECSFVFISKCIEELERRGLDEEGMYRKPGQVQKASKLMKDALEKRTMPDISDVNEWETPIICSAIKFFFSKQLQEPLLTFDLHLEFIEAGKLNSKQSRIDAIKELVIRLPPPNQKMLRIICEHLSSVAALSHLNLMKTSNLGVCFGPTLMRPRVETVATIADLKHHNKVVEVLIENVSQMFAETTTSLSVDSSRGNTPSDDHSDKSVESQKEKSSPSNRPHSSSMYVRGSNDTARNVTRSGSVPSPSPPENRQKPSSIRPKVPSYPHPQRPPPPPPDGKGTSFVRVQSAKFEGTAPTGPPKPKIPPGKPTLSSGPNVQSQSLSKTLSEEHLDSNRVSDSLGEREPLSDPPVSSPKPQEVARPVSQGEERSGPSDEEELFNRLWTSGRRAVALYNCDSEEPGELSFKKSDLLLDVQPSEEDGWYMATLSSGVTGLVPFNYIKLLESQND